MTSTRDQIALAVDLIDAVGPVLGSYPAPVAGEHSLPVAERAAADNDYLRTGIFEQLPVRYRLLAPPVRRRSGVARA